MSFAPHISPLSLSLEAAGGFVSRILMWLGLGFEFVSLASKRHFIWDECFGVSRHQLRAAAHRERRTGEKPPARNLEALLDALGVFIHIDEGVCDAPLHPD